MLSDVTRDSLVGDAQPTGSTNESRRSTKSIITIDHPHVGDGSGIWRIARDSGVLDLNSSYSYLLWCRDFATTSVVARADDEVVGFVTGYRRPDADDTLVVWQVAVDQDFRGHGLGHKMLNHVLDGDPGHRYLETTITEDNAASIRLFSAMARNRSAPMHRTVLFDRELFPDGHEPEVLFRIGPFHKAAQPTTIPGKKHKDETVRAGG